MKDILWALAIFIGGTLVVWFAFNAYSPTKLWYPFEEKKVKIVVSQPQGIKAGKSAVLAAQLAVEQAGFRAGDYTVELIRLSDSDETGKWNAKREEENATLAANDPLVVAYLGPQNSGAAKVSIPILNRAGIVQISQANTWPGLTKPGFAENEPEMYYPTGKRNYFRVVTTDEFQGPAGAVWAKDLGFETVYIVDDGGAYGKGVAGFFDTKAQEIGIEVIGHDTAMSEEMDFSDSVKKAIKERPDLVYYGGHLADGVTDFIKQLRAGGYKGAIMGPDAFLDNSLIERTDEFSEGIYITSVGIPVANIDNDRARAFRQDYFFRYGEEPEVMGATAYEAARVALAAVAKGGTNRAFVMEAVRNTEGFESMFGPLSFDKHGDVNQRNVSANTVKDGKFLFLKKLTIPE